MKLETLLKLTISSIFVLMVLQINAQISGSLQFNGVDNYVEVVNSPINMIGLGDFTFEAWIKGEESEQTSHPMIFSNRGANPSGGGVLFFFHNQWGGSQSKLLCVQIDESNYKFVNNGSYNGSLLDNKCHHVAVTRENTTLSFYADGVLFGTTSPTNLGMISLSEALLIGKDKATNNTFNGIISQCRIWNVSRTGEEILSTKDLRLQGDESGLIAYWEMNEGTGQVVLDKTNQYPGQLGSDVGIDTKDPLPLLIFLSF